MQEPPVLRSREPNPSIAQRPGRSADPFRSNPLLAPPTTGEGRSRRDLILVSVVLHALFPIGLLLLPAGFLNTGDEPERVEIVFYSPEEVAPEVLEPLEIKEPERRPEPVPEPEPVKVSEPETPKPPPPVELPPPVARKEPPKPEQTVRTEVFRETRTESAPVAKPAREARTGGFATAEVVAQKPARPEPPTARVAGFGADTPEAQGPVGKSNARVVAAGRFGDSDVAVPRAGKSPPRGTVTVAGFADGAAGAPAESARSAGTVTHGGFGDGAVKAAEPRRRERQVETSFDTPVEIVSKPKPDYTDEARRLRIEGDVVLKVTFVASGRLRVLKVVGGLGHGLDEAAVKAAEKIEFKPARRNGQAVDHTATLRVVFRLA